MDFFQATFKKKQIACVYGAGLGLLSCQGFCFAIPGNHLRHKLVRTFIAAQKRPQNVVQSNACRCSVSRTPAAFFFDVKIIPA